MSTYLKLNTSWGDILTITSELSHASLCSSSNFITLNNIPIYGLPQSTDISSLSAIDSKVLRNRFKLILHKGKSVLIYSEGIKGGGANCSRCYDCKDSPNLDTEGLEISPKAIRPIFKLPEVNVQNSPKHVIRVRNHNGRFDEICFSPKKLTETSHLTKRDGLIEDVKEGRNSVNLSINNDIESLTCADSSSNVLFAIKPTHALNNSKPLIALTSMQIYGDVQKFISTVTVVQNFINTSRSSLECEYILPYNESILITDILILFQNGRQITFETQRKPTNKPDCKESEDYSMYGNRGNTPCMVLNLGSIPPKSKITVNLKYITSIKPFNQTWLFQLPSSLTPQYSILTPYNIEDSKDFQTISVANCSYTICIRVTIHSDSPILNLISSSNTINYELTDSDRSACVYLNSTQEYDPTQDFMLQFNTLDCHVPKAVVQSVNNGYVGMFSFIPKYLDEGEASEDIEGCGEFVFLLDRSASMRGSKMKMAKDSVQLFLNSLPTRCKFNIISFGSHYVTMFRKSVLYKSTTLNKALELLSTYTADMKETNILTPMKYILRQPSQYPRSIFLLSDGRVDNMTHILDLVSQHVTNTRFHTFGIGNDVKSINLKAIAQAGRGIASVVYQRDEIRSAVIRALGQAIKPVVTDMNVKLNGERIPKQENLSTIYYNETFNMFVNLKSLKGQEIEFNWWNMRKSCYESYRVKEEDMYVIPGDSIQKIWAKNKIGELETEICKGNKVENSIIVLSLQHKLLSDYTQYLTVDRIRGDGPTQDIKNLIKLITFTQELPKEAEELSGTQHGIDLNILRKLNLNSEKSSGFSSPNYIQHHETRSSLNTEPFQPKKLYSPKFGENLELVQTLRDLHLPQMKENLIHKIRHFREKRTLSQDISIVENGEDYLGILSLQDAEGFWNRNSLDGVMDIPDTPEELKRYENTDVVWGTVLALKFLEKNFGSKKGHWILAAQKSIRWLKSMEVPDSLYSRFKILSIHY